MTVAKGKHPFPSRTRPLSPSAPTILGGQPPGKIGRCRSTRLYGWVFLYPNHPLAAPAQSASSHRPSSRPFPTSPPTTRLRPHSPTRAQWQRPFRDLRLAFYPPTQYQKEFLWCDVLQYTFSFSSLASPGDRVRINWSSEKEQALRTSIKWDSDRHQHTLAGGKHSTRWTEGNLPWDIREGKPVQITLVARPGKYACETDKLPVFLTVEMPYDTH